LIRSLFSKKTGPIKVTLLSKRRPAYSCFLFFGSLLIGIGLFLWTGDCRGVCAAENDVKTLELNREFALLSAFAVIHFLESLFFFGLELRENGCKKGNDKQIPLLDA